MKIVNISKTKFDKLDELDLSKSVNNTEAKLYKYSGKWGNEELVLKKLYQDRGETFANKLYTINALYDEKDKINIKELVMPLALASIGNDIIGYIMPYIKNDNLKDVLNSKKISTEDKVKYLKEVGKILEKVKRAYEYNEYTSFCLNDVHENNFVLNKETNKINVVDLDSVKIGRNYTFPSKYLSTTNVSKYEQISDSLGGTYKVNYDTEIYCYIVMILNFFFRENIGKISISDYFIYLEYLKSIGVSNNIVEKLSYIYTGHANENPYEYLDELTDYYGRTSKTVFEYIRTKKRAF